MSYDFPLGLSCFLCLMKETMGGMNVMDSKTNMIKYSVIVINQKGFIIFLKDIESFFPIIRSIIIIKAVLNKKNKKYSTNVFMSEASYLVNRGYCFQQKEKITPYLLRRGRRLLTRVLN